MKKFFKNIRKKSPAKNPSPARDGESPKLRRGSSSISVFGYDVREKELGKLHKAAWKGDVLKVQELAKKDSSPLDKDKRTPLHLACAQGHENVVQTLLEWKAKTNIGDGDSRTPLMKAVECQHEGCVALLLEERVELDSGDKDGNTCLHIAAAVGSSKIIHLLCQNGANLTIRNKAGLASLHVAVKEKQEDICRAILSYGGQVDIEDNNLRTPLIYACQDGSVNLVQLFLSHGASTAHQDDTGWSADEYARIQGNHACSNLIQQQHSSVASTPRSVTSNSGTLRGASPFALPALQNPENGSFGLPVADDAGEDSGEETVSRASAKGAGSDSWGEDTDISASEDRKKAGEAKINLARLVGGFSSDGEDRGHSKGPLAQSFPQRPAAEGLQSQGSVEENSWAASDSPLSPRRSSVKVSFKGVKELSEVPDITATESDEGESEHYQTIPDVKSGAVISGDRSFKAVVSVDSRQQSNQHKETGMMGDLGVDEVDVIQDFSDNDSNHKEPHFNAATYSAIGASTLNSEWDSTVNSHHKFEKPSILKKWGKVEETNDWYTTEMEEIPPPLPTSPQPKVSERDSDIDEVEDLLFPEIPAASNSIPKQGNNTFVFPHDDFLDKPSQDSEWDTTTEAVTPRAADSVIPLHQDSDWDSATEVATPRVAGSKSMAPFQEDEESDENSEDEVEASVKPKVATLYPEQRAAPVTSAPFKPLPSPPLQRDDKSEWDSEDDNESDSIHEMQAGKQPGADTTGIAVAATAAVAAARLSAASDTDDEIDNTETVSEWELEQKQLKATRVAQLAHKVEEEEESGLMKDESDLEVEEVGGVGVHVVQQSSVHSDKQHQERLWQEDNMEDVGGIGNNHEFGAKEIWDSLGDKAGLDDSDDEDHFNGEFGEAKRDGRGDEGMDSPGWKTSSPPVGPHKDQYSPSTRVQDKVAELNSYQASRRVETMTFSVEDVSREGKREQHGDKRSSGTSTGSAEKRTANSPPPRPQVSHSLPQPSATSGYVIMGPTAMQLKQRLQLQSAPHSLPSYHFDPLDSDDSYSSDADRNEVPRSSYPTLLGSTQSFRPDFNLGDDDVLSYTSTEFEGHEGPPISATTFPRDVLLNMNLSDPATLVQVQEYIRESKRHMDQERNQRLVLENKVQLLSTERQEIQRKLASAMAAKDFLEQSKIDFEARLRSLEYSLSEEQEKRRNSEMLLTKTKEQLARKEQQYTNELELKQRAELTLRNVQLEMRTLQNNNKELEEEREEMERQLQHEHNARRLQEQINQEQSRQSHHHDLMASTTSKKLGMTDDDMHNREDQSEIDKLSAEVYAGRMEMDRQRSRFMDEITLLSTENEELQNHIEDLKKDIRLNEEAMAHAAMQFNVQLGSLRTDSATFSTALDKERATRERLEAEHDFLQKRLDGAVAEKDKAVKARNDLEREFYLEKQSSAKHVEHLEEEVSVLKDGNQHLKQRLNSVESKLNSVENELHVSHTTLLERSNQLQQLQQEVNRYQTVQTAHDNNIRLEKELNTKLQVKYESLQERLAHSQQEVMSLRQQADSLRTASLNATSSDSHEQLTTILNGLRSDTDMTKALLEERNNSLMEQVQMLKEESRNADNRRNTLENDLRLLQTKYNEASHKLAFAEAQLGVLQKSKEQLENEREHMKGELHSSTERHRQAQEKCIELQARMADMTDRLDRADRTSQLSTQNLAATSASYTAIAQSKGEVEDTVQRLQLENARFETDLLHKNALVERLQAELVDSQKIVQLEKAKKTTQSKFQQAKSHSTDAEEQKTVIEIQLQEERQKNQQSQKEISNLKALLKSAKNRLKSQAGNGSVDIDSLQQELEMKYRRDLNKKLDEINSYLESQAFARDQLDTSHSEVESKLSADKRRLEEENANMRVRYEQAVAQRESLELEARRFKQLYESEMNWRMRLSDHLLHSTEKPRLLSGAKDRMQSSTTKLDFSGLSDFNMSHLNGDYNDSLNCKIRADLDRSIAKHLEAAPHHDIVPVIRHMEDAMVASSLTRSSRDYIDILKRKYFVP